MNKAAAPATEKIGYYESLDAREMVYQCGLPFRELLALNVDDLMQRIDDRKAALIVIDGGLGEGKTTLGKHIGNYVNVRHGGMGPIDVRGPQMALGGSQFGEKILECHDKNLRVIVYDEAGDFDKKTTLSRFNRNLMRIFEMYRGFKILVILCLPRFYKLENELLDLGIWRMTIHCEDRTKAQGNFRVYDVEQTYYIKKAATELTVKPLCYDKGSHAFQGHFLNLPPEESEELDIVSVEAKRQEVKKTVYDVKNRVTLKMIAKHFDKSTRWVVSKLKEVDASDFKMFNKSKWYKKEIIEEIEALED